MSWSVRAAVVAFAVCCAPSAFADDGPFGRPTPHCEGREPGDPCNAVEGNCGTCESCEEHSEDGGVLNPGCVTCNEIHSCTVVDVMGCSAAGAWAPAVAVAGGIALAWVARRRRR